MKNNTKNQLNQIISKILDIDIKKIKLNNYTKDFKNWDSLNTLRIMTSIEKKFKIKIKFGEIMQIQKISDLINLIEKKIN